MITMPEVSRAAEVAQSKIASRHWLEAKVVELAEAIGEERRRYWNEFEEHQLTRNCGNTDNEGACGDCVACLHITIGDLTRRLATVKS